MLVLGAIKLGFAASSCLAQNSGSITPVVTFDKVMEYLQMEVKEEKIIKAVEGTTFTLGQDQVAALKKAGASDALITAMMKKGQTIAAGSDFGSFVIILDCSGSMKDKAQGGTTQATFGVAFAIKILDLSFTVRTQVRNACPWTPCGRFPRWMPKAKPSFRTRLRHSGPPDTRLSLSR